MFEQGAGVRQKLVLCGAAAAVLLAMPACAREEQPLSVRVANAAMLRWPAGHIAPKQSAVAWGFEPGIVLAGFTAVWERTHDKHYFEYVRNAIDQFVAPDGSIRTYDAQEFSLNTLLMGRDLLLLYRATGVEKYRRAAETLHTQLMHQPQTASGGYWHAQATPNLMLLDDTFMYAPFMAEYAAEFHQPQDRAALTRQFRLLEQHARDPKTGLLYHGWDETRSRPWVDKASGDSATLWARGMGWYMMALADTLPLYPKTDPGRAEVLAIFQHTAAALLRAQDPQSGLWYQVLDQPHLKGNYIESSSVMMFVYALQKGVRLGYLPASYGANTERAWRTIQERFVQQTPAGSVVITGTVTHISLGAAPGNDGTHEYYLSAPVVSDDPKGVGAFLLAATEMARAGGAAR